MDRNRLFLETLRDLACRAARAMVFHEHDVSVRDLIAHAANVRGAVHIGREKTVKEEALSLLARNMEIGGHGAATRVLQAVARVTLAGLDPLKIAIEGSG